MNRATDMRASDARHSDNRGAGGFDEPVLNYSTSYSGPTYESGQSSPASQAGPAGPAPAPRRPRVPRERGLPGWIAVVVLIAIAGIGGVIDEVSGSSIRGAFNWALVLASIVAILLVRRSNMFTVVVTPPIVYFVVSAGLLYVRSDGLHNKSQLIDAATNWNVYGFPAVAGATAAVLLVAGIRMFARR